MCLLHIGGSYDDQNNFSSTNPNNDAIHITGSTSARVTLSNHDPEVGCQSAGVQFYWSHLFYTSLTISQMTAATPKPPFVQTVFPADSFGDDGTADFTFDFLASRSNQYTFAALASCTSSDCACSSPSYGGALVVNDPLTGILSVHFSQLMLEEARRVGGSAASAFGVTQLNQAERFIAFGVPNHGNESQHARITARTLDPRHPADALRVLGLTRMPPVRERVGSVTHFAKAEQVRLGLSKHRLPGRRRDEGSSQKHTHEPHRGGPGLRTGDIPERLASRLVEGWTPSPLELTLQPGEVQQAILRVSPGGGQEPAFRVIEVKHWDLEAHGGERLVGGFHVIVEAAVA